MSVDFVPWSVIHKWLSACQEPAQLLCLFCLKEAVSDRNGRVICPGCVRVLGLCAVCGLSENRSSCLTTGIYRGSLLLKLFPFCLLLCSSQLGLLSPLTAFRFIARRDRTYFGIFKLHLLVIWRRAEEGESPRPSTHNAVFALLWCSGRHSTSGLVSLPRGVVLPLPSKKCRCLAPSLISIVFQPFRLSAFLSALA